MKMLGSLWLLSFVLVGLLSTAQVGGTRHELSCKIKNNSTSSDEDACEDKLSECEVWAEEGGCTDNEAFMLQNCPCSCNACPTFIQNDWDDVPQRVMGPLKEEVKWNIRKTEEYMQDYKTYVSNKIKNCRNKHKDCSHWSLLGECQMNPGFMLKDCAAACRACHYAPSTRIK